MEKTGSIKYLKGITIALMIVYILFMFHNFLKGIWDWTFHFGNGEWNSLLRSANYLGKSYFVIYALIQILEFGFIFFLNRFVKRQEIGKGYHFLIILLSFLPLVNLFLFYIVKRKLNKQFFKYSGINGVRSDRKILGIWILMVLLVIYIFIIMPFLTLYVNTPELVSEAAYYPHFSIVVTDCCFLVISFVWLLYYLEFKRMLHQIELIGSSINDNMLLDS
jgi:hypothetical protein